LWAASAVAGESVPTFCDLSGLALPAGRREKLVVRLLQRSAALHRAAATAEADWRAALFGNIAADGAALAAIEARRLEAAHRTTLDRLSYYPLLWGGRVHKLRWQIPALAEVEQAYGDVLA